MEQQLEDCSVIIQIDVEEDIPSESDGTNVDEDLRNVESEQETEQGSHSLNNFQKKTVVFSEDAAEKEPFSQAEKQKKKIKRSGKRSTFEDIVLKIRHCDSRITIATDSQLKSRFEWVTYENSKGENSNQTLNYMDDFLKNTQGMEIDCTRLDLMEFQDSETINHHSQVSSVTDDIYKRILRYGQLDSISRIARKSGAIEKDDTTNNFRDELYYDQNDPFIDDEEYIHQPKVTLNRRMQLVEVFLEDFRSTEGELKDFVSSDIFQLRVKAMRNLEKQTYINDSITTIIFSNAEQQIDSQKTKLIKKPKGIKKLFTTCTGTNPLSAAIITATTTLKGAYNQPKKELEKKPLEREQLSQNMAEHTSSIPSLSQNGRKSKKKIGSCITTLPKIRSRSHIANKPSSIDLIGETERVVNGSNCTIGLLNQENFFQSQKKGSSRIHHTIQSKITVNSEQHKQSQLAASTILFNPHSIGMPDYLQNQQLHPRELFLNSLDYNLMKYTQKQQQNETKGLNNIVDQSSYQQYDDVKKPQITLNMTNSNCLSLGTIVEMFNQQYLGQQMESNEKLTSCNTITSSQISESKKKKEQNKRYQGDQNLLYSCTMSALPVQRKQNSEGMLVKAAKIDLIEIEDDEDGGFNFSSEQNH